MQTLLIPGYIKEYPEEIPINHIIARVAKMKYTSRKVIILKSSTGSGKSTILPVYLYKHFGARKVLSIQPRVFNTLSIPKYISGKFNNQNLNNSSSHLHENKHSNLQNKSDYGTLTKLPYMVMGKNIGYYTGSFYRVPADGILFMTSGSFIQHILNETDDHICETYNTIIIDEAHEVDIMGNNIHLFLREFVERCANRNDCPIIIITSAAFDHERFMNYYDAEYIEVGGKSYPIEQHFLEYNTDDYIQTAVDLVKKIHAENIGDKGDKDILIFLPGYREIKAFGNLWGENIDMSSKSKDAAAFIEKSSKSGGNEESSEDENSSESNEDESSNEDDDSNESNEDSKYGGSVSKKSIKKDKSKKSTKKDKSVSKKSTKKDIKILILTSDIVLEYGEAYMNLFKSAAELGASRKVILSTNVGETGITYPYLKYVIDCGYHKVQDYIYDYNIYYSSNKSISALSVQQRMGRVGRTSPGHFYALYTREIYDRLPYESNNSIYRDDNTASILQTLYLRKNERKPLDVKLLYEPAIHAKWRSIEKLYILGLIDSRMKLTIIGDIANKIGVFSCEALKIIISGYIWHAPILDLITAVYAMQNALPVTDSLFAKEAQCDFIPAIEDFYKNNKDGAFAGHYDVFMDLRDSVIDNLAVIGLDPFENSEYSYPNEDENYIKKIKQCIYEGLKLNSAWWTGSKYATTTGIEISERFPCHINNFVYSQLIMSKRAGEVKYTIRGKSVLDNYINFTPDFF